MLLNRLLLLVALFWAVLALPVILTFNSLFLWKVTLAVTEYGHRLAVLPALMALWSWRRGATAAMVTSALAALVLWMPLAQATWLSRSLPAEMARAFGEKAQPATTRPPLKWAALWTGREPASEEVPPQVLVLPAHGGVPERRVFFRPAQGRRPAPCLVVLHGGGWQSGRADEFPGWSVGWTRQGWAVAALEYRLAPQWQWPAPLEDVQDALSYLKARAGELGLDGTRFVLLGRSAGGQIASAAAQGLRDPHIRGCISLYAPADMLFARKFADPKDVLDSLKLIRQYLGGDPAEVPAAYESASGTLLARRGGPPTLIIHGRRDILVWHLQSRRLAAALHEAQVPHYFLDLPWGVHGLDYAYHGPGGQLTRHAVQTFLDHVAPP